jgi:hypothetical protein
MGQAKQRKLLLGSAYGAPRTEGAGLGKPNKNAAQKLTGLVQHHETAIDGEEVMAHWGSVPVDQQTDHNLAFERFHMKDELVAELFCNAMIAAGGFATCIAHTVRIVRYWKPLALRLLEHFETGPVRPTGHEIPYDQPRFHFERNQYTGAGIDLKEGGNRGIVLTDIEGTAQ